MTARYRHGPPPQPEVWAKPKPGRVLCFAPHPDDEAAGPGGTLVLHRQQGDPVRVVLATDGIAGDPDGKFDKATYGERRRAESRAAMAVLGVDDVAFWGLPDSCEITENDIETVAGLAAREIREFAPDLIYAPWEGEGHGDHWALSMSVQRALAMTEFRGLAYGYEIWNACVPDLIVDITAVVETKRESMRQYPSQLAYADYLHPIFGLNAHRSLLFARGSGYGEAFVYLRG